MYRLLPFPMWPAVCAGVFVCALLVRAEERPAANPVALNREGTVLLDKGGGKVLLKGQIALREGPLELLCCKKQTKEHESILAVDTKAYVIHTALLALGAKPGAPAKIEPAFQPASGQKIQIFVQWTDAAGKSHRVRAQTWVRYLQQRFYVVKMEKLPVDLVFPKPSELRYDRPTQELSWYGRMTAEQRDRLAGLSADAGYRAAIQKFYTDSQSRELDADWVFVGSGFYKDPETGKNVYLAEDGDLICVANFSNAVLDVPVRSSASNETLLFEAHTDRIPPKGTAVTLELVPVFEKPAGK